MKILIAKIKTFYRTNRTKKLALSAVVTTVVAGAVAIALLATPAISPIASNVSDGATVSKDAEKDKIAKDENKKDDAKKDETKDESKDEVKDESNVDTGTPASEGTATPENKPSTASNNSKPADKLAHTHNWVANMVMIPGQPGETKDEYILGETLEVGYYTWADGCKVKATDYGVGGRDAANAEHIAKHGQHEMGYTTETVVIEPQVIHTVIKEPVPEHQEQHGWKCSCGATKE